jgi:guanylate kinase
MNQNIRIGTVLVVSGPSGVGKSTILNGVRKHFSKLAFSVSCTTRKPRPGEENGVHYYFISREQFEKRIADNQFIEYADVFGNYYGTLRSEVIDRATQGCDVFLDIDVQGAMQIKAHTKDDYMLQRCCEFIFIAPPSVDELGKRLRGRGTEDETQLARRLGEAKNELSQWLKYNYTVINDDLNRAVNEFIAIIDASHAKTSRQPEDLFND